MGFKLPCLIAFAGLVGLSTLSVASGASARTAFPMKPAEYRKIIEKRLDSIWSSVERKLDFHNVTPDRKKVIRHAFDEEAHPVWVEVERASVDGTITRDEALKIREISVGLRGRLRGHLAADKKASDKKSPASTPPRAQDATDAKDVKSKKPAATVPPPKAPDAPKAPSVRSPAEPDPKGKAKDKSTREDGAKRISRVRASTASR